MRKSILSIFIVLSCTSYNSKAQGIHPDSLGFRIGESSIVEKLNTSPLKGNLQKGVAFSQESIRTYPKSFGEADALMFLQSLPGVATSNVASPGLYVMGGETSHNLFSIGGAPVFFSARLLGLFPTYHQDHFDNTEFKTMAPGHHLGASLSYDIADTLARRLSGSASVGLVSARGSLAVPVSDKASVTLSARRSFLNLFYRGMIEIYDSPILYDFWDTNIGALYKPDRNNVVEMNALYSHDDGNVEHGSWRFHTNGSWNNYSVSARWRHSGAVPQSHVVFASGYDQHYEIFLDDLKIPTPSSILHAGYMGNFDIPHFAGISLEISDYHVRPQSPMVNGVVAAQAEQPVQHSGVASLSVFRKFEAGDFAVSPLLDLSFYTMPEYDKRYFNADPGVTLTWNARRFGTITADFSRKHQYHSETGMLQSGLPTQFWVSAGVVNDPQEGLNADLNHTVNILHGAYTLTSQVYFKKLKNQLEYTGFFFDLLAREYFLEDNVTATSGENYGFNVVLSRNSGKLTGWLSYSRSRALRTGMIGGEMLTFPASHNRLNEFNALLDYKMKRVDLSANLVWASGTPFTPVKDLYFINSNLLAEYFPYNSGRLSSFVRTDASVDIHLPSREGTKQGINISVRNLIGTRFQISYFLDLREQNKFSYGPYYFKISTIPSFSYYYEF